MILTLIGYRATGKTTLAKLVAAKLRWEWLDADVEIDAPHGKTIASIFAEDGESAFRDLEAQVIADLCRHNRLVLAAGGGAPLRTESRQAMRQAGKVVWLTARPETILNRMSGDATTAARRPNLTDKSPLDEIVEVLQSREPVYQASADLELDTEGQPPAELAATIIAKLGLTTQSGES